MRIFLPPPASGSGALRASFLAFSLLLSAMPGALAAPALQWDYQASGAAGFVVHCGSTPGSYTVRTDVGNTLTATLSSLSPGVTWYCAVTAYDSSRKESAYSNEATATVPASSTAMTFNAAPASGIAPLTVGFTDTTGQLTNWVWDFGDGTTSTLQNPVHGYATGGLYSVTLTGRLADGSIGQITRTNIVTVSQKLWNSAEGPSTSASTDTTAVNLGVRFYAVEDGYITGLRFYKNVGNTGRHVANLWSSNGQKLAEASFTDETASGWQQVNLAMPVKIKANTTYIASYLAPYGRYSDTLDYFARSGLSRGPLRAPMSTTTAPNGLYAYGSVPTFPRQTNRAKNYWVDVVFKPGP
jgi:PKD repeat protein